MASRTACRRRRHRRRNQAKRSRLRAMVTWRPCRRKIDHQLRASRFAVRQFHFGGMQERDFLHDRQTQTASFASGFATADKALEDRLSLIGRHARTRVGRADSKWRTEAVDVVILDRLLPHIAGPKSGLARELEVLRLACDRGAYAARRRLSTREHELIGGA